jgi:hypothetical protein
MLSPITRHAHAGTTCAEVKAVAKVQAQDINGTATYTEANQTTTGGCQLLITDLQQD